MSEWRIFKGNRKTAKSGRVEFPAPPPWRVPGKSRERVLANTFRPTEELIDAVNAAIYLRRPLLITGKPGTGKSSLIFAVAKELGMGKVLVWPINSRSVLREGLYTYDALARLQYVQEIEARRTTEKSAPVKSVGTAKANGQEEGALELGQFLTLGPLGSALASKEGARALLVDEIDKSDVDLPNDLLNVLDTGRFAIPELRRRKVKTAVPIATADGETVEVRGGEVTFTEFPLVVMSSNGERDFPAPFLRRCVQFDLSEPTSGELKTIVAAHFPKVSKEMAGLIGKFVEQRNAMALATDQLLNAVHVLHNSGRTFTEADEDKLLKTLFQKLG